MFNSSPFSVRFQRYGQQVSTGGMWWLPMIPGAVLIGMALLLLIWPELLAYMVASALLFAGVGLTTWGWSMRKAAKRQAQSDGTVFYHVQ